MKLNQQNYFCYFKFNWKDFKKSIQLIFVVLLLVLPSLALPEREEVQHYFDETYKRNIRSPLRPPAVTSFDPGKKKSNSERTIPPFAAIGSKVSAIPPRVNSESKHELQIQPLISSDIRITNLPPAPYLTSIQEAVLSKVHQSNPATIQNDEHSSKKENGKHKNRIILKAMESEKELKTVSLPKVEKLSDLNIQQVSKTLNMTEEELMKQLHLKNSNFQQLAKLIKKDAKRNKKLFEEKNTLDLHFEEFIHKLPDVQKPINIDGNSKILSYQKKKMVNSINEKTSKNEIYKDFDDYRDSIHLPAKDSPMVTHFRPSKWSNKAVASVDLITIEEKNPPTKPPKLKSFSRHHEAEPKKANDDISVDEFKITSAESSAKVPTLHNNLRFVFPMKGILIFCGALGGLALITILITIMYAALKCKTNKKTPKNYDVNTTDIEST